MLALVHVSPDLFASTNEKKLLKLHVFDRGICSKNDELFCLCGIHTLLNKISDHRLVLDISRNIPRYS